VRPATPERLLTAFGRRLAELRTEKGLTQEELAARVDVAARYVQAIEAGRQNVTLATVARLAAGLRVPVVELFEAPESRTKRRPRKKTGR
jgi:transcriptional regulator with XRE-family HTH domain